MNNVPFWIEDNTGDSWLSPDGKIWTASNTLRDGSFKLFISYEQTGIGVDLEVWTNSSYLIRVGWIKLSSSIVEEGFSSRFDKWRKQKL